MTVRVISGNIKLRKQNGAGALSGVLSPVSVDFEESKGTILPTFYIYV
jgi:hypothetical protein